MDPSPLSEIGDQLLETLNQWAYLGVAAAALAIALAKWTWFRQKIESDAFRNITVLATAISAAIFAYQANQTAQAAQSLQRDLAHLQGSHLSIYSSRVSLLDRNNNEWHNFVRGREQIPLDVWNTSNGYGARYIDIGVRNVGQQPAYDLTPYLTAGPRLARTYMIKDRVGITCYEISSTQSIECPKILNPQDAFSMRIPILDEYAKDYVAETPPEDRAHGITICMLGDNDACHASGILISD